MKTYNDLQEVKTEAEKMEFVRTAINDHLASPIYREGKTAYSYFCRRNETIVNYQKLLYTLSGEAVPDNFSANYKFCNGFFPIFVKQETNYLLGNGVNFNEADTKDRLGGDKFDEIMVDIAKKSLWGGVAFGFVLDDDIAVFDITEFVPLVSEETGALMSGIRFWQISKDKPLRATLYELDGYTDYMWKDEEGEILSEKKYGQIVRTNEVGDYEILDGKNYPSFPIVPLWANAEHQSELTGLREKIDGYDLIQSGLCNTIDEASLVYWTVTNAGGMDDVDLAKFVERMKVVKAAVVDEQGSKAEAHTLNVPYQASQAALLDLRDSLYRDAMALDTDKISSGSITATAIQASYENLSLKCDDFETQVTTFIRAVLELLGIDDSPSYKRSRIVNASEDTQMILSAAQYLDDDTILDHIPFLNPDEIEAIKEAKVQEEIERFASEQDTAVAFGEELLAALDELLGDEMPIETEVEEEEKEVTE